MPGVDQHQPLNSSGEQHAQENVPAQPLSMAASKADVIIGDLVLVTNQTLVTDLNTFLDSVKHPMGHTSMSHHAVYSCNSS
jgi:hypothetical protein